MKNRSHFFSARTLLCAAMVLATLGTLAAQPSAAPKIALEDLLAVPAAATYWLSPDGKQFATVADGQIAIIPADGGQAVVLTKTPGAKSEVCWSPDGSKLAFVSEGGVWVVPSSGGAPRRVTPDGPPGPGDPRGATDTAPRWNPRGRWILYQSGRHGQDELCVVSEDGQEPHYLVTAELYYGRDKLGTGDDEVSGDRFNPTPAWSPDGSRIVYTERTRELFVGRLKVLNFDFAAGRASGTPVELYTGKRDPGGAWCVDNAVWSPDGKTLAVVLQDSGWDKVYLLPATGGAPKQLTRGKGEDTKPVFSPDGRFLAFVSNRNRLEERHIWLVSADGSNPRQLANLPPGVEGNPQWSPDGKRVYFVRDAPLDAPNLWVASISGEPAPRELTHAMLPAAFVRAGFRLPEVVHFKAKDGVSLAGILYRPQHFVAGTRYPAVCWSHGGPEGQDMFRFASWPLFLTQEGYVVLQVNFRGSTGYGEKFRNLNVEDVGGGEIDDWAAAAQYLVDKGLADPRRIAIGGGSHGGTVTANAVSRYPDVFAAGIEMFGVVDRAIYIQHSNRNSSIRFEIKMGGPPEAKPDVYRKCNVLLRVANIKTPLLILHGEEDPQVPPQNSALFAEALRKNGKTFWYHTYPREGHGFREREHRLDAWQRQLAFLRKYLQPDISNKAADDAILNGR